MRPLVCLAALVALASAANAAPAPFPRTATALERDPLYREAEAGVRAALDQIDQAQRDVAELSPSEYVAQVRGARALARQAAEKYTRLEASLSGVSAAQRNLCAMKAGKAWALAGDCAKAISHFSAVFERSGSELLRAEALAQIVSCHWRLNQTAAIRRLAPQARQVRNCLTPDDRDRLDNVLRWALKDR